MKFSLGYSSVYQGLPEQLVEIYPELHFENHCYLRIALDNTFNTKWDQRIHRPACKHLSKPQLQDVIQLLRSYRTQKALLLEHHRNSIEWRKKAKEATGEQLKFM